MTEDHERKWSLAARLSVAKCTGVENREEFRRNLRADLVRPNRQVIKDFRLQALSGCPIYRVPDLRRGPVSRSEGGDAYREGSGARKIWPATLTDTRGDEQCHTDERSEGQTEKLAGETLFGF